MKMVKKSHRYLRKFLSSTTVIAIAIVIAGVIIGILTYHFAGINLFELYSLAFNRFSNFLEQFDPIANILAIIIFALLILIGIGFFIMVRSEGKFWKKPPVERIRSLEERFRNGKFTKNEALYYSNLSVCYYDYGDCEKALNLALHAQSLLKEGKENAVLNNIAEANIAAYMIELGRLAEAAEILTRLNNIEGMVNSVKLNVKINLARFALLQNDIAAASAFADEASALSGATKNNWAISLIQAEISFAEGDVDSAREKAKIVVNNTANKFALARANKLL